MPANDAEIFYNAVGGSPTGNDQNYLVSCDSTATFGLIFAGQEFQINPEDWIEMSSRSPDNRCLSKVLVGPDSYFLAGTVFLRSVSFYLESNVRYMRCSTLTNNKSHLVIHRRRKT
jgi:Eukaryotic aspartyl protease